MSGIVIMIVSESDTFSLGLQHILTVPPVLLSLHFIFRLFSIGVLKVPIFGSYPVQSIFTSMISAIFIASNVTSMVMLLKCIFLTRFVS